MSEDRYTIEDMDGFLNAVRDTVFDSMNCSEEPYKDTWITLPQIENFLDEVAIDYDECGSPIIDSDIFEELCNLVEQRINNITLAKLCSDGFIECAWDNDKNDFIFWEAESSSDLTEQE